MPLHNSLGLSEQQRVNKAQYIIFVEVPQSNVSYSNTQRSMPVFLKVGGIAPLGANLMGKGAKIPKGAKMLNY